MTSAAPDARGRFGAYGGRFVPETLVPALEELEAAWRAARQAASSSSRAGTSVSGTNLPPYAPKRPRASGAAELISLPPPAASASARLSPPR